jgi:muramoyltetrapeptide carboxypeptidase
LIRLEIIKAFVVKNPLIIANADFGHTVPIFTFPVGGTCDIKAKEISNIMINLVEH